MATASDSFDRSNENPLAGNWTTITSAGAMRIVSNNALSASDGRSGAYYNAQTFTNDHFSEIVLGADGSIKNGAGCAVRVSNSAQTLYYIYTQIGTTTEYSIRLYRCVSGSFTVIGEYNSPIYAGGVIRLSAVGSTISVTQNGTSRISVTDTGISTGQYAGIWSYYNTRLIESWNAGDIPAESLSSSLSPSLSASISPSLSPSVSPSASFSPSLSNSLSPSLSPSVSPSISASVSPSNSPSLSPSVSPSLSPSLPPFVPSVIRSNISSYEIFGEESAASSVYVVATRVEATPPSEVQIIQGVDGDDNPGVGFGAAHGVTEYSVSVFGETLSQIRINDLHVAITPVASLLSKTHYWHEFTQGEDTLDWDTYVSQDINVQDNNITTLLIPIHGSIVNHEPYFDAINECVRGLSGVVIFAPAFKESGDLPGVNEIFWTDEWRQGNLSSSERAFRVSSFAALDAIIAICRTSFPNLVRIVVAGFSAGGQFATRYAATQTATDMRFICGGASSYLWMDSSRPGPRASGDNDYKYGLDNLSVTSYVNTIGATALRSRFESAKVLTLLGSWDVGDISGLDTTDVANAQGVDRRERFWNYRDHLRAYYGAGIDADHPFEIVSGFAHDGYGVLASYAARMVYFGATF